jgi:hypothetical protein
MFQGFHVNKVNKNQKPRFLILLSRYVAVIHRDEPQKVADFLDKAKMQNLLWQIFKIFNSRSENA